MSGLLQPALSAAGTSARRAGSSRAGRVALLAGANGRQGEALLNRLLGCGDYRQVVALADAPMAMGMRALVLAGRDALPPVDDAFIVIGAPGDPGTRSFYGRDAPFVQVHAASALAVAKCAVDAGAQRMVLLVPTSAWQQMGSFHRGLSGQLELDVAQLPLASLTILRPVLPAASSAGNLLQRVANVYLSLQMLMMPRSIPTMTAEQVARCALAAMRRSGPGVSVLGADALPALLAPSAPEPAATPADR